MGNAGQNSSLSLLNCQGTCSILQNGQNIDYTSHTNNINLSGWFNLLNLNITQTYYQQSSLDYPILTSFTTAPWNNYTIYTDHPTFSNVSVACYAIGTKLLCLASNLEDVYMPIEQLSTNSIVKTYKHGYRKVKYLHSGVVFNDPDVWCHCMYRLPKTDTMIDDLIVTGGHSILTTELTPTEQLRQAILWNNEEYFIDDKILLLASASDKFQKIEEKKFFKYYHLTLENSDLEFRRFGIYANGVLSETMFS